MPILAQAQTVNQKFGYFSMNKVFNAMPEKVKADKELDELKTKYDVEMKRSEDDFNAKYEDFLEGQRTFAEPILKKRQAELQIMMQKNVEFKKEAQRLLQQAQDDAYSSIKNKLLNTVKTCGTEHKYACIINIDNDRMPYVDTTVGEDISEELISTLNK